MTISQICKAIESHIAGNINFARGFKSVLSQSLIAFDSMMLKVLRDQGVMFRIGDISDVVDQFSTGDGGSIQGILDNHKLSDFKLPFPVMVVDFMYPTDVGCKLDGLFILIDTTIANDVFGFNNKVIVNGIDTSNMDTTPFVCMLCHNRRISTIGPALDDMLSDDAVEALTKTLGLTDTPVPSGEGASLMEDSDGKYALFTCDFIGEINHSDEHDELLHSTAQSTIQIVLMVLSLLQCKNVVVKNKTYNKKGKVGVRRDLDYSEIYIKVPGNRVIYDDNKREVKEFPFTERKKYGIIGQKRGHFKTFTEEKPLFGKHVGTWWWSPIFQSKKREYVVSV